MKPRRFAQMLVVLLAVVSTGCPKDLIQLSDFKKRLNAGDYAGIAQEPVSCEEVGDACGQLRLIKGDACFRLAKLNNEPAKHYACAVTELDKGVQYTKTWQQEEAHLNRPRTYANLCESLRALQDMERGSKADQLTQRLLDTSQRFLEAEPGDPAAVYYNASARYTQLRPALLQSPKLPDLCPHLNELIGALNAAMPRASGTDYQQNITRLQSDMNGAKHTVAGCN